LIPFAAIEFWHWWALAVLLGTFEAFAPGVVFGWLGMAAGLTGALVLVLPGLGWQAQLLAATAFALASLLAWFLIARRTAGAAPASPLNDRAARYIGRRCTVVEAIENGRGRIRVGDGSWLAVGHDAPVGASVRVVGVDGTALLVEPDPAEPADRAA
jgi:membrane protein implicated in regulation of membrane protease activity